MKQLFLILLTSITFQCFADSTEHLTETEADSLIARFAENPYIFSFCDCCDMEYGNMIKIETIKKIPCSYNDNYISLKVTGTHIANVFFTGMEAGKVQFMEEGTMLTEIIAINYTWGIDKGLAVPLGYLEYSLLNESCDKFANIPFSDENSAYLDFYNQWVKPYEITTVTTTGKRLNIRDNYSLTANVIGQLKKGTVCKVIKRSSHPHKVATYYDFWYYVELDNGTKGWILGTFTDASISVGNEIKIIGEKVNIRNEPSLDGKIVTQLNGRDNEIYEVQETTRELYYIDGIADVWYKIKIGRKEGWVFGQLTSVSRFLPD